MSVSFILFMLFVAMLLASLLIAAAAGIRTFLKRGKALSPHVSQPTVTSDRAHLADLLLLVAVAATWYNVSSGWVAEFTIYPIYPDMNQFGPQVFQGFGKAYLSRLPVITLPAGVMFLAWALLLWVPARGVSMKSIWLAVALCTAFVAITPLPAGAQGEMYDKGFSVVLYDRLIWSNGVRAVLFTLVGLLALYIVHQRWHSMNRADA
jgi:SNF family Na+-dependent transporter